MEKFSGIHVEQVISSDTNTTDMEPVERLFLPPPEGYMIPCACL